MNGKGGVSGRQRDDGCDEMGGKFAKNTAQKTHNCNNLAKLNDAKMHHLMLTFYLKDI